VLYYGLGGCSQVIQYNKMSDTAILTTIVLFFVVLGTVLPFIQQDFSQDVIDLDVKGIQTDSGQSVEGVNSIGGAIVVTSTILFSIITMFFWTFGAIPVIIDLLLFVPIRIVFVVLLFKLVRGVGG